MIFSAHEAAKKRKRQKEECKSFTKLRRELNASRGGRAGNPHPLQSDRENETSSKTR